MGYVEALVIFIVGVFAGMEVEQRWPRINDAVKAEVRHAATAAVGELQKQVQNLREEIQEMKDDDES